MRIFGFGLFLVLFVGLFSQPALSQPKLEIEETHYDFGVSYPNQFLQHDFTIWNKGDQPLEIVKVSTTCGCAAAILSATTVLPSASSIVSVTVVTGAPRKKKESATLQTNDPDRPRVTLDVETDVRNLWLVTPKSSFLFTEIPFNSKQTLTLNLKNVDNEPFQIKATSVKEPELSVTTGEPTADGVPIHVTVNAKKDRKIINDQVMIMTDHKKQPQLQIPVFGRIVGYIRFNRQRVFFGNLAPGEEKSLEISAQLLGESSIKDMKILSIESDSNQVSGQVLGIREDGQLYISLTYKAPNNPGYQTGNIIFKTNLDKEPITDIPFSALIRPKG